MLISPDEVVEILKKHGLSFRGALHIGAHECEEMGFYGKLGLTPADIVWVDAIESKVAQAKARGIPNVYQAVITNEDDSPVTFRITNNVQSSSVLEFGTHAQHHPHVKFIDEKKLTTTTLDTFLSRNAIDPVVHDFWNFDIQGAELMALRGGTKALESAKAIYLEVNTEEVYKGCAKIDEIDAFLIPRGFIRVKTAITQFGWGDALYVLNPAS